MKIYDGEYYRSRAEREERAANAAESAASAKVHRELADLYRKRIDLAGSDMSDV